MLADSDTDKNEFNHNREKHLAYRKAVEDDLNAGFKSVSVSSSLKAQYVNVELTHTGSVRFS